MFCWSLNTIVRVNLFKFKKEGYVDNALMDCAIHDEAPRGQHGIIFPPFHIEGRMPWLLVVSEVRKCIDEVHILFHTDICWICSSVSAFAVLIVLLYCLWHKYGQDFCCRVQDGANHGVPKLQPDERLHLKIKKAYKAVMIHEARISPCNRKNEPYPSSLLLHSMCLHWWVQNGLFDGGSCWILINTIRSRRWRVCGKAYIRSKSRNDNDEYWLILGGLNSAYLHCWNSSKYEQQGFLHTLYCLWLVFLYRGRDVETKNRQNSATCGRASDICMNLSSQPGKWYYIARTIHSARPGIGLKA